MRIVDDGAGLSAQRASAGSATRSCVRARAEGDRGKRPEYEGMGLGLFIAKTLLERTGADAQPLPMAPLRFCAAPNIRGDRARWSRLLWPAARVVAPEGALGENQPIHALKACATS